MVYMFCAAYFVFHVVNCKRGIAFQNPVTKKLHMSIEMYGANLREIHHFEKS